MEGLIAPDGLIGQRLALRCSFIGSLLCPYFSEEATNSTTYAQAALPLPAQVSGGRAVMVVANIVGLGAKGRPCTAGNCRMTR